MLRKYKHWFWERVKTDLEFCKRILELKNKRLGCFCHPLACHEEDPKLPSGYPDVEKSRAFARGWFGALAGHAADLRSAGWNAWRISKSPAGARAYHIAMQEHKDKAWPECNKLALRSFFNAGPVVSIREDGLVVLIQASNERKPVNWNIAKWKIEHGEIPLSELDRKRLKGLLQDYGWGVKVKAIL